MLIQQAKVMNYAALSVSCFLAISIVACLSIFLTVIRCNEQLLLCLHASLWVSDFQHEPANPIFR